MQIVYQITDQKPFVILNERSFSVSIFQINKSTEKNNVLKISPHRKLVMADMYRSFTSKIEFPARKSSPDQNKARYDIWNSILVSIHNQRTNKNYYSINQVLTGVRAAA